VQENGSCFVTFVENIGLFIPTPALPGSGSRV